MLHSRNENRRSGPHLLMAAIKKSCAHMDAGPIRVLGRGQQNRSIASKVLYTSTLIKRFYRDALKEKPLR